MQIDGMGAAQPKGVGIAPKSPQQAESKPAGSGEEVSLNKPPKWAQVLVQQALQFALEINGQHYQAPRSQEFKLSTAGGHHPGDPVRLRGGGGQRAAVSSPDGWGRPVPTASRMKIWPR